MDNIKKELEEKGYCIIENILSKEEIDYALNEFKQWQKSITNHDFIHNKINPHGIYKYHRAGHTRHAWFIRTRPQVQDVFKYLWNTDNLVSSFDGSCYISENDMSKDKIWTHTDQSAKTSVLKCYQAFVSLTTNKERTFRVYEGSHKIHKSYFENKIKPLKERINDIKEELKKELEDSIKEQFENELKEISKQIKKYDGNWNLIDHNTLKEIEENKKILHVKAGSLVIWDSRVFHQNQYGKTKSEERIVQYVCYLPKNHPANTQSMKKKRLKYFEEQRTTSHWPYPIKVNSLQPRTYGNKDLLINYDDLKFNDLKEFEDDIKKLL